MKPLLKILAPAWFFALAACDAGSIRFAFTWPEGRPNYPPDVPATTFTYLQQRSDPEMPGRDVLPVLKTPFSDPNVRLDTPYENNLVFIAELRLSPDAEQVEYHGQTEQFNFHRGDHLVLDIFMQPTRPPQPLPAELGPSIVIATSTRGYVNRPNVELLLFAQEGATQVRLSNVVGLPEEKSEIISLSTLEKIDAPPGYRGYRVKAWDLDRDAEPCVDRNRCRRETIARFGDAQGYFGPAVLASVILDQVAPSLIPELTRVDPEVASNDSRIAASLTASEIILEPELSIAQRVDFPFVRVSPVDHLPTATYTFTSSNTAGSIARTGEFLIRADLRDYAGNIARLVEVGAFHVDTIVPVISEAWAAPSKINGEIGRLFSAGFTINKPARFTVTLGGRAMDRCTENGRAPAIRVSCERAMRGDEIPAGTESIETLSIDAEDDAQNIARRVNVPVAMDFRNPGLFAATFTPEASGDDLAQLAIVSDEPLEEGFVPELHWNGLPAPFEHDPLRDNAFERYFVIRPPINIPPGEYELAGVTLRDEAQNTATATTALPKRWLFDPDAPQIENFTVTVRNQASLTPPRVPAIAGTSIDLDFQIREPNLAFVRVLLGARELTSSCTTTATINYHCTYTTTGNEYPLGVETSESVLIEAGDRSGARQSRTASIIWDYAPPSIQSVSISPAASGLGSTARLTVSVSEALATGFEPQLIWSPPISFAPEPALSTLFQHVFTFAVQPSSIPTTYALERIGLRDLAGNEVMAAISPELSWLLDNIPPVLGPVTVNIPDATIATTPPRINRTPGRVVEVLFEVTEMNLSPLGPRVFLGSIDISSTCASAGTLWTCRYTMTGSEPGDGEETLQIVDVRITDLAANTVNGNASVIFDFAPPQLIPGTARIELVPGANNVLRAVSAARDGTEIILSLGMNEQLAGAPRIEAQPGALAFATDSGSFYRASHTLGPSAIQGTRTFIVEATDLAGNTVSIDPGVSFDVDTLAPNAPDVDTQDRIVLERAPWGDGADPSARLGLSGGTGAVEAGAMVLVSSPSGANPEIARIVSDTAGAIPSTALNYADTTTLRLEAVDGAGNVSLARTIRDVGVTMSLNGKVPGSNVANPHALYVTREAQETIAQAPRGGIEREASSVELAAVTRPGGDALTVTAGPSWSRLDPAIELPAERKFHTLVHDRRRGCTVMFGGEEPTSPAPSSVLSDETWELCGEQWRRVQPVGARPSPRRKALGVYDASRECTLIVGGETDSGDLFDAWCFDGTTWTEQPSTAPYRPGAAIGYHEGRGVVLVFGGLDRASGLGVAETWQLDASGWSQLSSLPFVLAPVGASMGYWPNGQGGGHLVMFGGYVAGRTVNTTWTWDGAWTSRGNTGPTRRAYAGMATDPNPRDLLGSGASVILFGGENTEVYRDTWRWDGASWQLVPGIGQLPPARATPIVYDGAIDRFYFFGGDRGEDAAGVELPGDAESWFFDRSQWRRVPIGGGALPSARAGHVMAASGDSGLMMFGGDAADADVWHFSGAQWTPSFSPGPGPLESPAMTDIELGGAGGFLLFGGARSSFPFDQTWAWHRSSLAPPGQWERLFPANAPSARLGHAMAHRTTTNEVVLFGGRIDDTNIVSDRSTWVWSNGDWIEHTQGTCSDWPTPHADHAMAFDARLDRVFMFGGVDRPDLWRWDGVCWVEATASGSWPSARKNAMLVYDTHRGRVLLIGGTPGPPQYLGDMWALLQSGPNTTATWLDVTPEDSIFAAVHSAAVALDPAREQVVLTGGDAYAIRENNRTFLLSRGPYARPGIRLSVDFTPVDIEIDALESMSVSAVAGGRGRSRAPAFTRYGALLRVWDATAGRWFVSASNAASLVSPSALSYTTPSAEQARRLISPASNHIEVEVVPWGEDYAEEVARARLDHLELRLSYRLP